MLRTLKIGIASVGISALMLPGIASAHYTGQENNYAPLEKIASILDISVSHLKAELISGKTVLQVALHHNATKSELAQLKHLMSTKPHDHMNNCKRGK